MRRLLVVTAAGEAGAGVALIGASSAIARLVLGVPLDSAASVTIARLGGAGLLTLGIASWLASFDARSGAARGLVAAMVFYNLGAALVLGFAVAQPAAFAAALWLGVGLHAAMAVWCIVRLRDRAGVVTRDGAADAQARDR